MLYLQPLLIAGSVSSDPLPMLMAAWDHAYRVAPGVAIACLLALAVPLLAVLAWLTGSVVTRLARVRTRRAPVDGGADDVGLATAWVRPDGASPIELTRSKTLTVVGRDQDADLVLDDQSVAAHHAAIELTPDHEYWIIDLTGPAGPGVSVDNHRVARRRLTGGERIALGSQRLTFESRLR